MKDHGAGMHSDAVLIFGSTRPGKYPVCRSVYFGDEAYERNQLSNYMQEIISIRSQQSSSEYLGGFPQLAALAKAISAESFFEIGSTLFSSIDKYEKCLARYSAPSVNFIGVEPSKLLRETAEILHPTHRLVQYLSHEDVPPPATRSISRSYQASSYAFQNTVQLVDWVSQFDGSQDGIWFSLREQDEQHDLFGKTVTLFSFRAFAEQMRKRGFMLSVLSAQKVSHFGFEMVEIHVTSSRQRLMRNAHGILGDGDFRLIDHGTCELGALEQNLWLQPKVVPTRVTSRWTSLRHGGALDFSGAASMAVT